MYSDAIHISFYNSVFITLIRIKKSDTPRVVKFCTW